MLYVLVFLFLVILVVFAFVRLSDRKKQITSTANGGMIASARKRREMLHEAGRKAMEDFNKGE